MIVAFAIGFIFLRAMAPDAAERLAPAVTTTTIAATLSPREVREQVEHIGQVWDEFDACPYYRNLREGGMGRRTAIREVADFLHPLGPPIPQVVAEVRKLIQEKC